MSKLLALAVSVGLGLTLSACASGPHTDATMLSGGHQMPPKGGYMSDRSMPAWSADCTKEALERMPPEHRQMCEQHRPAGSGQPSTGAGQPHNP